MIRADKVARWPEPMLGKDVEIRGKLVRRGSAEAPDYVFEKPTCSLARLADLVGQKVRLVGKLCSLNGVWWFGHHDAAVCLDGVKTIPTDYHFAMVVVTGTLQRRMLPDLDQIALKDPRDLKEQYFLDNPRWNRAYPQRGR